ncbi:MAG: hypothetical protein KF830_00790 [Planctomycetes bacterium]|nr:hypothetical protein [Planctomycetota bacterium]
MPRHFRLLAAAAMSAAALHAQCPAPTSAGLVQWSSGSGYASTWVASDEGISSPPIALPFAFPMPGAVGTLDQMWVNSNGEIYLTDSTLALTQPAGGASFGVDSLGEIQGPVGGSARVVPMGDDCDRSQVAGANWSVTVDLSVGGQVRVVWIDMARYANTTDRFSFAATLFASGVVQFDYSSTVPADFRYVGISVGNAEPTGGSQDITSLPSSPATQGILFESFTTATWDLSGQSVLIVPDLTPGVENYQVVAVTPYVAPTCASNVAYGTGCYRSQSSAYQLFTDMPSAKAALDGNGIIFAFTGTGYTPTFVPGLAASFLAPSGGATTLTGWSGFTTGDDGSVVITSSSPVPVPGGTESTWNVSANGILTAGATANNLEDWTPTGADLTGAAAPALAFYTWHDFNLNELGSGPVQTEEVGGVLYITWNGVECYGTPSPNVATWQFQVDLASGTVTIVWVSMNPATVSSAFGDDTLVGMTLAGVGPDPGSQPLNALPPVGPDAAGIVLSASPPPVINPSTTVTYTATNLAEYFPASGIYISTLFLSVNPLPGGFDLGVIGAPGCNAYLLTLDLDLGGQLTFAPTASWSLTYDNVNFAPGNAIAAQAISLVTPFSLPNGQNAFGLTVSNGVLSTTQLQ